MTYNPALDGIRAFAVLAVMLFHARVPGFGGGYLGVDVFFVLSGFLIMTLLLSERQQTGRINVGRFIERRLMRLAPALALVCVAFVVAASWLWPQTNALQQAFVALTYFADYGMVFSACRSNLAIYGRSRSRCTSILCGHLC